MILLSTEGFLIVSDEVIILRYTYGAVLGSTLEYAYVILFGIDEETVISSLVGSFDGPKYLNLEA